LPEALCLFREKLAKALREAFSDIKIGTHGEHISGEEFRERVKKLFRWRRKYMGDAIPGRVRQVYFSAGPEGVRWQRVGLTLGRDLLCHELCGNIFFVSR
jgi:hypothetical protein